MAALIWMALLQEDLLDLLDRAKGKERIGDYESAVELYTRAIAIRPVSSLYLLRGLARWKGGDRIVAFDDAAEAAKLDPDSPEPSFVRGSWQDQLGKPKLAIEEFQKSMEIGGPEWSGYEDALHYLDRLGFRADPKAAEVEAAKAKDLATKGDYLAAARGYSAALRHAPREPKYWYERGICKYAQRQSTAARVDFRRAVKLDERNAMAWAMRGETSCILRDWAEAIECLEKAIRLTPTLDQTFGARLKWAREEARK